MAAKKYNDGINFLTFMSLFTDTNGVKKELDYIFFDRANGVFVATNTRMLVVLTPKNYSADEFYDTKFPHYSSENGLEFLTKNGIGLKYNWPYPEWKRVIPSGEHVDRLGTSSMWKTTIEQNIILDTFKFDWMRKALKMIDVYGDGIVTYSKTETPSRPIMYEVDKKIRYGTGYDDYFFALVQVIVMPVVGLGE